MTARANLVLIAALAAIALTGCHNENSPTPTAPRSPGSGAPGETTSPATTPPSTTPEGDSTLVGEWQGINGTPGLLTIGSDHTYTYSSGGSGAWQATSEGAVFSGTLSAWNGGQATIDEYGVLEFYWQSSSGTNYFVFEKVVE